MDMSVSDNASMSPSGFPVSKYYDNHVLDAETVTRTGSWWTAILLIRDPKSGAPFISCYKWQKSKGNWKNRQSFKCKSVRDTKRIIDIFERFSEKLASNAKPPA